MARIPGFRPAGGSGASSSIAAASAAGDRPAILPPVRPPVRRPAAQSVISIRRNENPIPSIPNAIAGSLSAGTFTRFDAAKTESWSWA